RLLERGRLDIGHDHLHAFGGEPLDHREADAARGTRHHGYPVSEPLHGWVSYQRMRPWSHSGFSRLPAMVRAAAHGQIRKPASRLTVYGVARQGPDAGEAAGKLGCCRAIAGAGAAPRADQRGDVEMKRLLSATVAVGLLAWFPPAVPAQT